MLAPRRIEAWLPTTCRPQALHKHSLLTSKPPWDTPTTPLSPHVVFLLVVSHWHLCKYLVKNASSLWFNKTAPHISQFSSLLSSIIHFKGYKFVYIFTFFHVVVCLIKQTWKKLFSSVYNFPAFWLPSSSFFRSHSSSLPLFLLPR